MKEILETLIKSLVENKEDVKITEKEEGNTTVFEVSVNSSDMGKVIGRQGKVAKSIRTVMKSIAGKEHKKIVVEFID
ncbi:MAG: KH domain-containing protein [Clostridia bacterium]|nr:KH domain-containing protein [Clostridia bacterium]